MFFVINSILIYSPIHTSQNTVLESLVAAERAAEDLRNKLGIVINDYMDQFKNDSSISTLALDVSKISVLKVIFSICTVLTYLFC